jgi:hypothetical protein
MLRESYSEAESQALRFARSSPLISAIPDKTGIDCFGCRIAGIRTFQKLDREGLLIITDEEPDADGFAWTPMVFLTAAGEAMLSWIDTGDREHLDRANEAHCAEEPEASAASAV